MGGKGKVVHVLPDSERVEEALCSAARSRRFVDASGFLTFSQFLERFEPARRLGRRPVSALGARVLVHAAAASLPEGPFDSFVREPAFARAALELFFELKAGLLPPLGFRSAVQSLHASRQPRARYLADLYDAYEKALSRLELADREDLTSAALAALKQDGLPPSLRAVSRIELSALYDFPPLRRELLLHLAEACERAGVELSLELPAGGGPGVDAAVDPLLREFEKRAQELTRVEVAKSDLVGERRPLALLGPALFGPSEDEVALPEGALTLLTAASAREEVRLIARKVRAELRAGTPPERIAIAYRDLSGEAEWLEEALEELHVPARLRRGAPLVSTAAGRSALELPLLVDDGFPAEAVAKLLGGRYVPRLGSAHDDGTAVARVLAEASVRDDRLGAEPDRGAYDVRLTALAERLQQRGRVARADDVRTVRERCIQLIRICGRIPEEGRAAELLERWWSVAQALGIPEAARAPESGADERSTWGRAVLKTLARDQAAADALAELFRELAVALEAAGASDTVMSRRTFHRWLQDAAADFNLAPRGPRGGAVRILDLRELPGRTFDAVFVAGAVDGRLPGRMAPHPLLPDEDRAGINRHQRREVFRLASGEHEGRAPWRLAEDRLLFFLGLSAATGHAFVTAARRADGREQILSPFVDELSRRTRLRVLHEPLRPVPRLSEVASEGQLRDRLALELLSPEPMRVSAPEPGVKALMAELTREDWFREAASLSAMEEERVRFFSDPEAEPGPWTGALGDPELREVVRQLFAWDRERPVAATTLERFGNCAFQGFLAHVLRLEEPEAPGEEQDRKGQGAFWHTVLELLIPRLREQGLLGKPVEEIPDRVIEAALDEAAERSERRDHVGHPTLWKLSRERARAMVRRVLGSEHGGMPFDGHLPAHTELVFGRAKSPEGWREVVIPALEGEAPVYLEGKIDRVDRAPAGLGVVDYKSGATRRTLDELLSTEFQLPIYLYAAAQSGQGQQVRAAWLSLKTAEARELSALFGKKDAGQGMSALLDSSPEVRRAARELGTKNLANAVQALASRLRAGHFPARPQDCGFCMFRAACRITDRRVGREEPS